MINQVLKSNNVWLDHEDANASRRYKLADTGGTDPATGAFAASYRLWSSADGVHVSAATASSSFPLHLPGVSNEGGRSPSWSSYRLFLGPAFRLVACWNRLGEAVKTSKKREKMGENGRDTV